MAAEVIEADPLDEVEPAPPAPSEVVAPEQTPDEPEQPAEPDPVVAPEPPAESEQDEDEDAPKVMHFDVPQPGFIPEGFIASNALQPTSVIVGFIPDEAPALQCEFCDFTTHNEVALAQHMKARHN